jgi:hypothetical protein
MSARGGAIGSGIEVHDALKKRFGFDRGIVRSYRLTYGEVAVAAPQPGDVVTETLVELQEETTTTVGTGRSWVIDVERRRSAGPLISVERWSMFGYSTGSPRAERERSGTTTTSAPDPAEVFGSFNVTPEFVRTSATANGVDVAVHHDVASAQAAGARDIFLDTKTQAALFSTRASELTDDSHRMISVELRMRAPICAGDTVGFVSDGAVTRHEDERDRLELRLRAVVGDNTVSTAVVAFSP